MLPGSLPCTKHHCLWGCHGGLALLPKENSLKNMMPNIFRVSLAITLIYTTPENIRAPRRRSPCFSSSLTHLKHPSVALPEIRHRAAKNILEIKYFWENSLLRPLQMKKRKKSMRDLDNLGGIGAGSLTPITVIENVPILVLIMQISASSGDELLTWLRAWGRLENKSPCIYADNT